MGEPHACYFDRTFQPNIYRCRRLLPLMWIMYIHQHWFRHMRMLDSNCLQSTTWFLMNLPFSLTSQLELPRRWTTTSSINNVDVSPMGRCLGHTPIRTSTSSHSKKKKKKRCNKAVVTYIFIKNRIQCHLQWRCSQNTTKISCAHNIRQIEKGESKRKNTKPK